MKTFEDAVKIEFPDLGETITKAQIQHVYDKYKTKWPSHIASKENRISRGVYSYTFLDTVSNQTEEIALQKVIEPSIEVPEIDPAYVPFGFFKDLTNIIKSKRFYPILISGHHGSGKTKMVEQVCAQLKRPLIRVNISIDTDETDLIGGPSLENGNIVFKDGPILTAMKTGSILSIDEVDRGSSKLLCILSILEGSPFYNKRTGETIHPKDGFNIIATANTKGYGSEDGKYLSQIMDQAFLERYGITVEQDYPDAKTETTILSKVLDDKDFVSNLVKWANIIRETYNQGGIDDFISTRRLIHIANAFAIFKNKKKAIELCVARFDSSTKEAFIDLYSKVDAGETFEEESQITMIITDDMF